MTYSMENENKSQNSNFLKFWTQSSKNKDSNSSIEKGRNYEPKLLESGADKVVGTIRFCWSLSYWTSPLLLGILYRRGYFTHEGVISLGKFAIYVGSIYYFALLFRGIGRYMNTDYMVFATVLLNAQRDFNQQK